MTVFGWDASDYDWDRGSMDYAAAKRDGIVFATHKATEGTSVQHEHFGDAMRRAKAAGIPVLGAYHVVRTGNIPAQVSYYLARLDAVVPWWRSFPYWIHQVDVEIWPYDRVSAATGKAFAVELRSRGVPGWIVIYASQGQYGDQLKTAGFPLWNANYGDNPAEHYTAAYPGDKSSRWSAGYTLLQYGSKTKIGTQPTCDADAYRGTLGQLKALIGGDDMLTDLNVTHLEGVASRLDAIGHLKTQSTMAGKVLDPDLPLVDAVISIRDTVKALATDMAALRADLAALKAQPQLSGDITVPVSGSVTAHIG